MGRGTSAKPESGGANAARSADALFAAVYSRLKAMAGRAHRRPAPYRALGSGGMSAVLLGRRTSGGFDHRTPSADRFQMRGNDAAQMIGADNSFEVNGVSNCLIADNHSQHELIQDDTGTLTVDNRTLANNAIDNGYVFHASYQFTLTHSIVDEPGRQTIDYGSSGCRNASYTLNNDLATLSAIRCRSSIEPAQLLN